MRQRLYKMLMNQEGGSPGGGAVPPVVAPAAAQAAPQPAATVSIEQVQGLIDAAVLKSRNGIFADIRRGTTPADGTGGTNGAPVAPVAPTPIAPTAQAAAAPTVFTQADVQKMIARSNAVIRIAAANSLSDAQVTRMEAALEVAKPDDHVAWATSYLGDFGLLKSAQPVQPAPTIVAPTAPIIPPPTGPQLPPISNLGAPTVGAPVDWKAAIIDSPFAVTAAIKDRAVGELGEEGAARFIAQAGRAKAAGLKVQFAVAK